jgi:hypothetical protein
MAIVGKDIDSTSVLVNMKKVRSPRRLDICETDVGSIPEASVSIMLWI